MEGQTKELKVSLQYQSGRGVGMDLPFEAVAVGERSALFLAYHTGGFDRSTAERYPAESTHGAATRA